MAIVSLRDMTSETRALNNGSIFRMMVVTRNLTAHSTVVWSRSEMSMVNRDITVGNAITRYEEPVLFARRIAEALDHYERALRGEPFGGGRTRWDAEQRNVDGAREWNNELAARENPRILLSAVFLEALRFVADTCGFTLPADLPMG
jgi:hypothetical protein